MLTSVALLGVGVAGWGLGRSRKDADAGTTVLTVFAAVTAHSMLQFAFVDGRMDKVLGDPRRGSPEVVAGLIAASEAVGLWLPVVVLPWARIAARVWGALYLLAASTAAAAYHYFPFDLVVVSDEFIAPDGPPYLAAVFACLPIAGLGYLVGWTRKRFNDEQDNDGSEER